MDRVIVSVKKANEAQVRDLELPADVPAEQLSMAIANALGWSSGGVIKGGADYDIEATPPGRILAPYETLAQAQAWDGSWLVFYRKGTRPPSHTPPAPPPSSGDAPAGPVARWKKIDLSSPGPSAPNQTPPGETSGKGWKQIDE